MCWRIGARWAPATGSSGRCGRMVKTPSAAALAADSAPAQPLSQTAMVAPLRAASGTSGVSATSRSLAAGAGQHDRARRAVKRAGQMQSHAPTSCASSDTRTVRPAGLDGSFRPIGRTPPAWSRPRPAGRAPPGEWLANTPTSHSNHASLARRLGSGLCFGKTGNRWPSRRLAARRNRRLVMPWNQSSSRRPREPRARAWAGGGRASAEATSSSHPEAASSPAPARAA